jgi:hypothetical protein
MRDQARDKKGNYLYRLSIHWQKEKDLVSTLSIETIARPKPIKRLSIVLNNLVNKKGIPRHEVKEASLSIYEKWDYERNNPI